MSINSAINDWYDSPLSALGELSRGKSKHRPRNDPALFGGEYPFIQTGDVKHSNFYVNSFDETYNEIGLKQSKLWPKDTLCITIAANIAETAVLKFPACFPDSIVGFIENPEKSDFRFIKYALDYYKKRYQERSKGAAQDNLSLEKIESLKLRIPKVELQRQIADIIFNYDRLIENNEKRIKILEEMAQRLYEEWFVKFKFSGYKEAKIIDGLPEGWKRGILGDKLKFKKGINITEKTITPGDIPVVAGGLEPAYYHNKPNVTGPVITISASGANAGYVNLYFEDIWASDCSYVAKELTPFIFFYYLFLKNKTNEINNLRKGAAQPHVYPKDLNNLPIIIAPDNITADFEKSIEPIYFLIGNLKSQIKRLTVIRDLLIPQLVTGKRELKS